MLSQYTLNEKEYLWHKFKNNLVSELLINSKKKKKANYKNKTYIVELSVKFFLLTSNQITEFSFLLEFYQSVRNTFPQ